MPTPAGIELTRDGRVATCVIDHPAARNALTPDMLRSLTWAIQQLSSDPDVAVIVITSANDASFSSGYDLRAIDPTPAGIDAAGALVGVCAASIEGCSKPVIAKVNGVCFGAAVEIVLSCDLRLATADAEFAIPSSRLGFLLPMHFMDRLLAAVGPSTASRLLLLGERVPADEARRIGLVHAVSKPDEMQAELLRWTSVLVSSSAAALAATKRGLHLATATAPAEAETRERAYVEIVRDLDASADPRERIASFRKRTAQ